MKLERIDELLEPLLAQDHSTMQRLCNAEVRQLDCRKNSFPWDEEKLSENCSRVRMEYLHIIHNLIRNEWE